MTCPRLFEAEALRDGRLGECERAGFARHATTCRSCAREVAALDDVGRTLRAEDPVDELGVRRERARLLSAYDGHLVAREEPRHRVSRVTSVAALVVVVVVAGVSAWQLRPRIAPSIVTDRSFRVDPTATALETAARAATAAPTLPPAAVRPSASDSAPPVARPVRAPPLHAAASSSFAPVRPEDPAAAELRAAVRALDEGDNTRAASELAAFSAAHPDDPRTEDADYLRVIALQRAGDERATRDAARAYLERHRQGFRRDEVERLAGRQ